MARKKLVVIGLLGPILDSGLGVKRWSHWRPTVGLCQQEELLVDRLELLHQAKFASLAQAIEQDIRSVSPETEVRLRQIEFSDAWDLESVYGALHDFARSYPFRPETEDYLVHITTGTHIAQICLFLLTESRHLPARLIQTAGHRKGEGPASGTYTIIDLDLSRYDRLASRFRLEKEEGLSFLKAGIDTRNRAFNRLVEQLERVAGSSRDPLLLTGPTGAGKTELARRIHELKRTRRQLEGALVEVNCATLRGDGAMSALFGHVKGAFTGATADRPGLLRKADKGMVFLDEIGELGLDEQAMLLGAIETGEFYPLGSDRPARSEFQLVAGTNRDLAAAVRTGRFREDLLARINLWTFRLPGLRERPEDLEPNLDFGLDRVVQDMGVLVRIGRPARERFLTFARSPEALWPGNFRDFNASLRRMATLCNGGRISSGDVEEEISRLEARWLEVSAEPEEASVAQAPVKAGRLGQLLAAGALDRFDRVQLEEVARVCRTSRSLSEAGRKLFAVSRKRRSSINDADRLRKYLARFGLEWSDVAE